MPDQREQHKEMDGLTLVLHCEVLSTISRQQCGFMLPEELLPALFTHCLSPPILMISSKSQPLVSSPFQRAGIQLEAGPNWSAGKQNEERNKLAAWSLGSSCWRQHSPLIPIIPELRFQGDCCFSSCHCNLQWHVSALPENAPAAKSSRGLWWVSVDTGMAHFDPLLCKASWDTYPIYNINHHKLNWTNCSQKSWDFTPGIYIALCHR